MVRSTGSTNWENSGKLRMDWVWIRVGAENAFGALKGWATASLYMLLKLRDPRNGETIRLAVIKSLVAEKGGQAEEISGLITVTKRMKGGVMGGHFTVVNVKTILGMAHLVPECAGPENWKWIVNSRIDLKTFNEIW